MEPAKRTPALIPQMDAESEVGLHAGGDTLMDAESADFNPKTLRGHFAPDALDREDQQVVGAFQFEHTERPMARCSLEFDILRCKAESRVPMGTAYPDAFVSVFSRRMRPYPERSSLCYW